MRAVAIAYALALVLLVAMFPPLGRSQPAEPSPPILHNDAFEPPPPSPAMLAGGFELRGPSQFMAGDVAVLLLLPESSGAIDPNREDWTPEQIAAVTREVRAGLDWWEARLPKAALRFQLDVKVVPTDYEPTTRPMAEEGLWVGDTLRRLGYQGASYFDQAYAAADDLRAKAGADWGTVIFMPNSERGNGYLADGRFAYAYINGPFSVITSDAGAYGLRGMAAVVAHEIGHTFGALDQYPAARIGCDRRSGYLDTATSNSQFGNCGTRLPSIMLDAGGAFAAGEVDPSALHQIGYRDSDGDGTIDPLDTVPTLELQEPATASGSARPLFRGTAREIPFPSALQNDVSLHTIKAVEFRVNGGPWLPMEPADGAFDSKTEPFSAELPLYDGRQRIEVRAVNSAGNSSEPIAKELNITWMGPAPRYSIAAPAVVASPSVNLALTAPASTTGMQISSDPRFPGAAWQPFRPQAVLELVGSDGARTVYVRFRDQFGLPSLPLVAPVVLDTTPPSGSARRPSAEPSTLLVRAEDAATAVVAIEVQVGTGQPAWQPFAESIALPQANPEQPVLVRLRDAAGNISAPIPAPLYQRLYLPLTRR